MPDISGFGLKVTLTASITFPNGVTLTQFSDDTDPVDSPSVNLREVAMGLNGDLISWSKANAIPVTVAVIPGTTDDSNLQVLAAANRAAAGRTPAQDVITLAVMYADGTSMRLLRGVITDGIVGKPVASSGRMKTKTYQFQFADFSS